MHVSPKLRRSFAAAALLCVAPVGVVAGCADAAMGEPAAEAGSTSEEGDPGSPQEPDPSMPDEACARAGGEFGILATHSLHGALSVLEPRGRMSAPGLVIGPEGLWASFLAAEGPDDREPLGYGIPLGFDGSALQAPVLVEGAWAGGRWWPGSDAAVVTHCNDRVPGWTFVDLIGQPLAPSSAPAGDPGCFRSPSAAWVSDTDALVAWLDTEAGCDDGSTCVRVSRASPQEHGTVFDLFDAGDPGSGPNVSVAAGPVSAMVAMVRIGRELEIVTQPLEHDGSPIAPPTAVVLPPSDEPGEPLASLDARVAAQSDGSFYVYVGGWGFSLGRMHIGAGGELLEPLTALPPIVDIRVWGVYNHDLDGVFPRPGGWVAVGGAVTGGQVLTLVSALGPDGELAGQVILPQHAAGTAVASDGEHLWALTVSVSSYLYELGCVVP